MPVPDVHSAIPCFPRLRRWLRACPGHAALWLLFVLFCSDAAADDYDLRWGPPVGTQLPLLEAPDHRGETQHLATLRGKRGLLLFMNRSADW